MTNDYKVLYRKYRPTTFDEIVGQKYSIAMLKNAVENNKISHAYIFTGPRGTGKTSTAKIFARTINCENPKNGVPCGTCSSCINNSNNADIIEIDAASNNGVDSIREIINNVKIAPTYSKYKIYIIDEVHELSDSAFNALLLTLEEPPSHIVFIFATTDIEKVPITILSRCQRYDFKKLTNEELKEHLKNIATKENIEITDEALEEIAYLADGGCRDALSILNQLCTSNEHIDLDTVLNNYGSVSMAQIKNIVNAYIENQYDEIKNIFDNIEKMSIDYKVFLKKLVDQFFQESIHFKMNGNNEMYLKIKDTIFEFNDIINKININVDPFLLIFLVLIKNMEVKEVQPTNKEKETILEDKSPIKEEKTIDQEEAKEQITEDVIPEKKEEKTTEVKEEKDLTNEYIEQLKKVRINNCFAKADKSILLKSKEKWQSIKENSSIDKEIESIIIDTNTVLASNEIHIITDIQESIVELFNTHLEEIEKQYKDIVGEEIHFIALTTEEWEEYKKDYVKKLKEKYVYHYLEEPLKPVVQDDKQEAKENLEEVISIFDKEKVEIK